MAEGEIEINGGIVVYEWVGPDDGDVVVRPHRGVGSARTSAGSTSSPRPSPPGNKRVLLWHRPNCGRSDVQLYGPIRVTHAGGDARAHAAGVRPSNRLFVAGGSGGARDSIVFTMMYPEMVR